MQACDGARDGLCDLVVHDRGGVPNWLIPVIELIGFISPAN